MGSPSIAGAEGASHGQAQGRRLALSLKSGYVSPCQMNTVVELLASYGRVGCAARQQMILVLVACLLRGDTV